jgi:glutaredoxin
MEKDYLGQKGVKFENVFVDLDQQAAQDMIAKSGQMGVPVTEFTYEDGKTEYLLGFDKLKIDQILGLS